MPETPIGLLTFREVWRHPRLPEVIHRFLPAVHGTIRVLIPENPAAADTVSIAVFDLLKQRRRSSRRLIGPWLIRSAIFGAQRERKRLNLPYNHRDTAHVAFKKLFRLKQKYSNALIQQHIIGEPIPRSEKATAKATAKLAKKTKQTPANLATFFDTLRLTVLPELEAAIASQPPQPNPRAKEISSAWFWLAVSRLVKRTLKVAASIVFLIAAIAATTAFLYTRGHLLPVLLTSGQKNLLKQFPALAIPAKPLPVTLAAKPLPETSADLFNTTNIWPVTIRLSREQWKEVQPKHIPPLNDMNAGGRFQLRNPKASRSGLAGVLGIDFQWAQGTMEFAGQKFPKVGIRLRGNGTYLNSLYGPKQSYKVDLNRNVKGQDIAGVNSLNFVNSIPDLSYIRDALAQKLFRELGTPAPRTAYAYLTLDAPPQFENQPLGLYVLIENIDGDFAKDRFGTKATPIFKPVTYELFKDLGPEWQSYASIYDLKTKATPEQVNRVIQFAKIVTHANDDEFARQFGEFVDIEEYAAFVAGHVVMSSYDGYLSNGQNFYLYLDPKTDKFGFIPWDQDHGWGEFGYVGKATEREDASIWNPHTYNNRLLKRALEVPAFREAYRKKIEQALAGPFTIEKLYPEIDALAAHIRPAVAAENPLRLERFEIAVSTNWVSGPRDGHNMDTKEGIRAPSHQIKRFIAARVKSLRDQLDGKSEGVRLRGMGQ